MTDSSVDDTVTTPPADEPGLGLEPVRDGGVYRVLARKYRPTDFSGLIGQEALVRTLTNAIKSGRVAHAFMLTGVRGVGKTTTARVMARALNCIGPDGSGGPTPEPCGVCEHCVSIAEDRHVDVLEMDAASHTGVDDIREIVDGVRYAPSSARYKIYVIDEIHMLSRNAFNALLKTLEEPPEHVKFIFATTEIRKIPVTVLSRCQRFDLRRVDSQTLIAHFDRIAGLEGVAIDPDALAMLARAADGSVRDGLSLLDQAISLSDGRITAQQVRDMLGLADRSRVIDLFENMSRGKAPEALSVLDDMHRAGADPLVILQDLLDLTHQLTRVKVDPRIADDPAIPEEERVRGRSLVDGLSMASLSRMWQMLLKGVGEVQMAPLPHQAVEMVLIRIMYARDLPPPGDLIRALTGQPPPPGLTQAALGGSASATPTSGAQATAWTPRVEAVRAEAVRAEAIAPIVPVPRPREPAAATLTAPAHAQPADFRAIAELFRERDPALFGFLYAAVHPVRVEPGRLEIRPLPAAPKDLAGRVTQKLSEWTGARWVVSIARSGGDLTLDQQDAVAKNRARSEAAAHPVVSALLDAFPGATISTVRNLMTDDQGITPDTAGLVSDGVDPYTDPYDDMAGLLSGEDEDEIL